MKYFLLIISGLLAAVAVTFSATAASSAYARQTSSSDLSGVYTCQGTLPDGQQYTGTVVIVRHQNTYQLLWTLSEDEHYLGIGIQNGDSLSVSYFWGMGGVVGYQVDRNGQALRLKGQWTVVEADGRVFGETLTRVADAPPTGPHFKVEPAPGGARRGRIGVSGRPA